MTGQGPGAPSGRERRPPPRTVRAPLAMCTGLGLSKGSRRSRAAPTQGGTACGPPSPPGAFHRGRPPGPTASFRALEDGQASSPYSTRESAGDPPDSHNDGDPRQGTQGLPHGRQPPSQSPTAQALPAHTTTHSKPHRTWTAVGSGRGAGPRRKGPRSPSTPHRLSLPPVDFGPRW